MLHTEKRGLYFPLLKSFGDASSFPNTSVDLSLPLTVFSLEVLNVKHTMKYNPNKESHNFHNLCVLLALG